MKIFTLNEKIHPKFGSIHSDSKRVNITRGNVEGYKRKVVKMTVTISGLESTKGALSFWNQVYTPFAPVRHGNLQQHAISVGGHHEDFLPSLKMLG